MAQFLLDNRALECITVTVEIKKKRWFDLRLWVGVQLIKLGAMIAGFGFKESETDT